MRSLSAIGLRVASKGTCTFLVAIGEIMATALEHVMSLTKKPEQHVSIDKQEVTVVVTKTLNPANFTPCNWTIIRLVDNGIKATNGITNVEFEGTLEEFNAMLRGE